MIRTPHGMLLPKWGLMQLAGRHALFFVPEYMRGLLVEPMHRSNGITVVFDDCSVILKIEWLQGSYCLCDLPADAVPKYDFDRVPTHVIIRLQRRWRAARRVRRRATIAMALHHRLGADAAISCLGRDALQLVADCV